MIQSRRKLCMSMITRIERRDYYQVALTRVINILQRSGCRQDCVEQGE
jgi:hypothetical protein